jgi:hypothetical protein
MVVAKVNASMIKTNEKQTFGGKERDGGFSSPIIAHPDVYFPQLTAKL